MRLATLIAAHDKPEQLSLLIDTLLRHDNDDFVVLHLDAKSKLWKQHGDHLSSHSSGRVHVIQNPVAVHWGHRSQIDATLLMLEYALAKGFTLAHHISGVDWPITRRQEIQSYLSSTPFLLPAFIEIVGIEQTERMQKYWLRDPVGRNLTGEAQRYYWGRSFRSIQAGFNQLANLVYGIRDEPYGPWYKGWSWWSLPYDIANAVFDELCKNTARLNWTACPDEHIIPTIVNNRFPDRIQPYRRFIRWSDNAWNPETLTKNDIPAIEKSDAWFARKIDMTKDDSVVRIFTDY